MGCCVFGCVCGVGGIWSGGRAEVGGVYLEELGSDWEAWSITY
jgi:hypothetical protein